ncbi:hypothetical protein KO02_12515 [Sphingobacterium sp. ML3W]|uniref:hypothetical protein n=1 Tax=Sphingobacterium sp. ML3W TaxID=1538644 RepID=UPI0004F64B2F|nr:hypothetical protein [Sphingobacterium sp. ML3W]AIM37418.1 hypothetical protein KO02_12515 [Sphingobacterium sp. ML3W]
MRKILGEDLPIAERADFLRDNADSVEEINYMKQFGPDELLAMKERHAEISIEIKDLESEKKDFVSNIKSKQKPLKNELSGVQDNIKFKAIAVKEACFKFVDHDSGQVGYYNAIGDMVQQRPIFPQERQKSIFQMPKEGTND